MEKGFLIPYPLKTTKWKVSRKVKGIKNPFSVF